MRQPLLFILLIFASIAYGQSNAKVIAAIKTKNLAKVKQLVESGEPWMPDFGEYSPIYQAILVNSPEIVNYFVDLTGETEYAAKLAATEGSIPVLKVLINRGADPSNAMIYAAERGKLSAVKFLLEQGADPNHEQKRKRLLFFKRWVTGTDVAIKKKHTETAKYLVSKGADVDYAMEVAVYYGNDLLARHFLDNGANPNKALGFILKKGDLDLMKHALNKDADCNNVDGQGRNCFLLACEHGNMDMAMYSLKTLGQDINGTTTTGETALLMASASGNRDLTSFLLANGASTELTNNDGETALFYAIRAKNLNITELLLQRNANINYANLNGMTPLMEAAKNFDSDIIRTLLARDVAVNAKSNSGYSAFQYLLDVFSKPRDYFEIYKLFIEKGADINAKYRGEDVMFQAIEKGELEMMQYFLGRGANINTKDGSSQRPRTDDSKTIKFLIENGADINAYDNRHDGYLCEAVYDNDLELAFYLINKGIDMEQDCYFEEAPLFKAIKEKSLPMVKLLVESGANLNAIGYFNHDVMYYAERDGGPEILAYLKAQGAIVEKEAKLSFEQKLENGRAFAEALKAGDREKWEALFEQEMTLTKTSQQDVAKAAIDLENLELLTFLLNESPLKIDDRINNEGQSMLIVACLSKKTKVLQFLIDKGADLEKTDDRGKKAYNYADKELRQRFFK